MNVEQWIQRAQRYLTSAREVLDSGENLLLAADLLGEAEHALDEAARADVPPQHDVPRAAARAALDDLSRRLRQVRRDS